MRRSCKKNGLKCTGACKCKSEHCNNSKVLDESLAINHLQSEDESDDEYSPTSRLSYLLSDIFTAILCKCTCKIRECACVISSINLINLAPNNSLFFLQ